MHKACFLFFSHFLVLFFNKFHKNIIIPLVKAGSANVRIVEVSTLKDRQSVPFQSLCGYINQGSAAWVRNKLPMLSITEDIIRGLQWVC